MATSKAATVTIVVTRSFGTLNEGERFETPMDDWTRRHIEAGVLREVDGGAGQNPPRAS